MTQINIANKRKIDIVRSVSSDYTEYETNCLNEIRLLVPHLKLRRNGPINMAPKALCFSSIRNFVFIKEKCISQE